MTVGDRRYISSYRNELGRIEVREGNTRGFVTAYFAKSNSAAEVEEPFFGLQSRHCFPTKNNKSSQINALHRCEPTAR